MSDYDYEDNYDAEDYFTPQDQAAISTIRAAIGDRPAFRTVPHDDEVVFDWGPDDDNMDYDQRMHGAPTDARAVWVLVDESQQAFGWHLPNGAIVIPQNPDGSPRFTRPDPDLLAESEPMDLAGNFEAPFAPSPTSGGICVCVCCGTHGPAGYEISKYPFRYIPIGWSVNARNKAVRCETCKRNDRGDLDFYNNQSVDLWLDHPGGDSYARRGETVCVTRHHRAPPTARTHREEPYGASVDVGQFFPGHVAPQEKESPVSESETKQEPFVKPSRGARLKKQGKEVAGAFGAGLQLAAANEAGEVLVDIAKELTGDMPMMQLALEHPDGREVAKVMMALMLHTATEQTDIIPQGQFIGEACKLQMTASSFTLIAPRLNKLRKHFQKLAKIGEQVVPATTSVKGYTESELAEAYAEMERELHAMKVRVAELEADEDEVEVKPARRGKRSAA